MKCKYCNSNDTIKYGHYKNTQEWWCKTCSRKFADNHALPGMKTPIAPLHFALASFYKGVLIHDISQQIEKKEQLFISESTIYRWINLFAQLLSRDTAKWHPLVGNKWIAIGTGILIAENTYQLVDVIDSDTKFILSSTIGENLPTTFDQAFKQAVNKAKKHPKYMILSGFSGSKDVFKGKFNKIIVEITDKQTSQLLKDRFRRSYEQRNNILIRLKKKHRIQLILDGWIFHHNYKSKIKRKNSPSEIAGITRSVFANQNEN